MPALEIFIALVIYVYNITSTFVMQGENTKNISIVFILFTYVMSNFDTSIDHKAVSVMFISPQVALRSWFGLSCSDWVLP